MPPPKGERLRRGWTTGACAAAATRAAYTALLTGGFPDPVAIELPKGQRPSFALADEALGAGFARAGIVKDAGDDPDVTHLALVHATVREGARGSGVEFRAGPGVGTVTRPGLPVAVGEPAINPVPRRMMRREVAAVAAAHRASGDVVVEIGVRDGERLAGKTWNPRLGIVGGLSILGTTGVVIPYSCSAWIHSIHRGVDVARAMGLPHVAGCTGRTSEGAVQRLHGLPDEAMIDMGDFAGGSSSTCGGIRRPASRSAAASRRSRSSRTVTSTSIRRAAGSIPYALRSGRRGAARTPPCKTGSAPRARPTKRSPSPRAPGQGSPGRWRRRRARPRSGWCGAPRKSRSSSSIAPARSPPARMPERSHV